MKLLFLRQKIKSWSEIGIKFPMAHDPITKMPSITLFFPYIAFLVAMASVILLMRENALYGAMAAIGVWVIALVLYLMRRLSKAKIDINDGELELESEDEDEQQKSNS